MLKGTTFLAALLWSTSAQAQSDDTPTEPPPEAPVEEAPPAPAAAPPPPEPAPAPVQQEFSQEALSTVVVNVNVANETPLELGKKVRRYYLKYVIQWPKMDFDVTPVDYATHTPLRERFVTEAIGYNQDEMERYWIERGYQSSIIPPVVVDTEVEMLQYVKANPGAIGYVSAAILQIDGATDNIRIIGEIPPEDVR